MVDARSASYLRHVLVRVYEPAADTVTYGALLFGGGRHKYKYNVKRFVAPETPHPPADWDWQFRLS